MPTSAEFDALFAFARETLVRAGIVVSARVAAEVLSSGARDAFCAGVPFELSDLVSLLLGACSGREDVHLASRVEPAAEFARQLGMPLGHALHTYAEHNRVGGLSCCSDETLSEFQRVVRTAIAAASPNNNSERSSGPDPEATAWDVHLCSRPGFDRAPGAPIRRQLEASAAEARSLSNWVFPRAFPRSDSEPVIACASEPWALDEALPARARALIEDALPDVRLHTARYMFHGCTAQMAAVTFVEGVHSRIVHHPNTVPNPDFGQAFYLTSELGGLNGAARWAVRTTLAAGVPHGAVLVYEKLSGSDRRKLRGFRLSSQVDWAAAVNGFAFPDAQPSESPEKFSKCDWLIGRVAKREPATACAVRSARGQQCAVRSEAAAQLLDANLRGVVVFTVASNHPWR